MVALKENLNLIFYVGTSRFAACLAEIGPERSRILRFVQFPEAPGFQKGGVAELDKALATVEEAVKSLELGEDAFEIPTSVILSTPSLKTTRYSSSVYYSGYPRVITSREIRQVVEQTRNVAPLPLQDWILQVVPESFWVNDLLGVVDPVGLEAQRLAVALQIFSVDYSLYRNLSRMFETFEFPLKGYYPKTFFLALGVLNREEGEGEALVIDLADEVTHLVLTREGKIERTKSLDFGGRFLTAKIAERWKIGTADAKRLKERFGTLEDLKSGEELIPLFGERKGGNQQIRRSEFHGAFLKFSEELFSKIQGEIAGLLEDSVRREPRFVLTGGGAKLEGAADFLGRLLAAPVRLGTPRQIEAPVELLLDPAWSAPLGFIRWLSRDMQGVTPARENALGRVLSHAKEFLTAYF